jgi:two-component system, chemotaxis family, protein-glutamate methylesterase/glutaminase
VVRHWRLTGSKAAELSAARVPTARGEVVAVAASTGGPAALYQLLSDLPGDFPTPLLIVQHISPGFVPGLAEYLTKAGTLRVKVAQAGERLAPRTAYLAPDGAHLGVGAGRRVKIDASPPLSGFRPSASYLFESAAQSYGRTIIAVILTGMGEDGAAGLKAVRQAGGHIIAQDEATSLVFGMPRAAIRAGLADQVLPLERIGTELTKLVDVDSA